MIMNKRGQGGMSMEMFIGLIALVLVLLFAVLFFSGAIQRNKRFRFKEYVCMFTRN